MGLCSSGYAQLNGLKNFGLEEGIQPCPVDAQVAQRSNLKREELVLKEPHSKGMFTLSNHSYSLVTPDETSLFI